MSIPARTPHPAAPAPAAPAAPAATTTTTSASAKTAEISRGRGVIAATVTESPTKSQAAVTAGEAEAVATAVDAKPAGAATGAPGVLLAVEAPTSGRGGRGVPDVVGVLGGGRMGVGIAHAFLLAGARAIILERDETTAEHAHAALETAVRRSVERGSTTETETALRERIAVTADVAGLAGAGLVVEAVPEDAALKTTMLQRVEAVLGPDAWLASNTSSLSIDNLAASLSRPERFCGLHFFNPVPASTLVEIVRGAASTPALIDAAQGWVAAIGKTPITVKNSPGFASSRLGVVIALEAMRMLEEGVASAEDIDAAMVLGYKFPVGPLRLTDLVGLDVRLGISDYLASTLGDRFASPEVLRQKVAEGKLGRKSGEGFFVWADGEV
ncbi:MAG: 3-hydroxybutyryl-CoA dehydrogenase [Subtercola sp.]|nr:3-hydroxybutyryl-CoA dehydrogenase [Subtercola sp.]